MVGFSPRAPKQLCRCIAARIAASSSVKRGCSCDAQSSGFVPRGTSFVVASERRAQGRITACSSPLRCCAVRERRAASPLAGSKLSVAQQAAGADRPNAGAFGMPRRQRRGGGTAAALGAMKTRAVRIESYFSLPTDLAAEMRCWAEFVSGDGYTVLLRTSTEEILYLAGE